MSKICKLAIDIGHNVPFDGGAVGIRSENELNYNVGTKLIQKCRAAGVEVVDCMPHNVKSLSDSLSQRAAAANNSNADFFISIHHNASPGASGSEVLCIVGGRAQRAAEIILGEIVKVGFRNRGVKDGHSLYVIRKTVMPAILIECAFCDSAEDMNNYDTEKMSEAIFTGICVAFDIQKPDTAVYYNVVKGDTLSGIARKYGNTVGSIATLNGIKDVDFIVVGQRLRVR